MPKVLLVDAQSPDPAVIAEAARVLRGGGLVAFPTETVYGLGARALDPAAVARVFEAKGRPAAHPLIAHVASEEGARAIAAEWGERASRLARAFWPGPLTLVVPRGASLPAIVAGGGDSVAIRMPAHPVARALIEAVGEPVAAPSANRYQTISPTRAAHVVKSLGDRVDVVLDGGACPAGIESTVVDVRGDVARLLRPGALSIARIREVDPTVVAASQAIADHDAVRASPGMDARHYAPRAELRLVSKEEATRATPSAELGVILMPDDPEELAARLYDLLHALDDRGVKAILVEAPPEGEAWAAVRDRLERASRGS